MLDYQLYLQREAHFIHEAGDVETPFYEMVAQGNVEQILENQQKYGKYRTEGKGSLSKSPLRNQIYHLVVNATLLSRACSKAGMPTEVAYTLTDIYIQKADHCKTVIQVMDLNDEMVLDFVRRMKALHEEGISSHTIRRVCEYICDHLHERLTTEMIAEYIHLNRSYLSTLFKRETGETLQSYMMRKRLETAAAMLRSTDASCADIAFTLSFSTQSYFTECFRKRYGCTPGEYRKKHIRPLPPTAAYRQF